MNRTSKSIGRAFVGRKAELDAWLKILANPTGQAVLVIGQQGMGKTMLLSRMADIAETHPDLQCGHVRYEVTPTDAPDSTMALILDNAWEGAGIKQNSLEGTPRRLEQWRAFLNVFNVGDLILSLRRDPARSTRDQFLATLETIAGRLKDNARLLVFIDPEKYLPVDSADTWRLVIKDLPDKIKLVFAQRLEDQLLSNADFGRLPNVVTLSDNSLIEFNNDEVEELISIRRADLPTSITTTKGALSRYKGYPYAVGAALDLLVSGLPPDQLPADPDGLAAEQWKRAYDVGGANAWKIMTAYAILEIPVPDTLILSLTELLPDELRVFRNNQFLNGLLREEPTGTRLYHTSILEYRISQLSKEEVNSLHQRASQAYRDIISNKTTLLPLAATRLPEHVLCGEGDAAFIQCLIYECTDLLRYLCHFDQSIALYNRAHKLVACDSYEECIITGNIGLFSLWIGDLNQAEPMFIRSLNISNKIGWNNSTANSYNNLGLIYARRGDSNRATEMFNEAIRVSNKLNLHAVAASAYGNLAHIYEDVGDLTQAEAMLQKTLAFHQEHGDPEDVAKDYGNLGVIYLKQSDLARAESMFESELELSRSISWIEGQARATGNLSLVHKAHGEYDIAAKLTQKAIDMFGDLGLVPDVARECGNLAAIYTAQGDSRKAESMYSKAIGMYKKLDHAQGMAFQYANLGLIAARNHEKLKAKKLWLEARELYKKAGMLPMVMKMQGWLDSLSKET